MPSAADACMRGRVSRTIASTSSSLTSRTGRHGSTPAAKQPSLFHRLPMPAIVRWSSRASPIPRVGSSCRSRRRNSASSSSLGQDVGPERGQPLVEARARLGHQLQHRAAELDHVLPVMAHHEPGGGRRGAFRPHPPGAGHAQVRVDDQVALEADEEVLAVDVDRAHRAPAQALGPAVAAEARVRRRDLVRHAALQDRPDAACRVVDGVALRHGFRVRVVRRSHGG